MLDADLTLDGLPPQCAQRTVRHNIERFPDDFAFPLSKEKPAIGDHKLRPPIQRLKWDSVGAARRTRRTHRASARMDNKAIWMAAHYNRVVRN
jgi:hypothetical protein